jgi:hypothetical protein
MMCVDDEVVRMRDFPMSMRMRVRRMPFPPQMFVIVVFVVDMDMIVNQRLMRMGKLQRITGRPDQAGGRAEQQGAAAHQKERRFHAGRCAKPAGQRISQQPTGMLQRKLRRTECRTVLAVRGASEQNAARRQRERHCHAE